MKMRFLRYIVIIIIILIIVFLSQKPYFKNASKNLSFPLFKTDFKTDKSYFGDSYLTKANNWLEENIYPRFSREVEERGELVKEEITKQKDEVAKSSFDGAKKYLAGELLKILNLKPSDLKDSGQYKCQE